MNRRHKLTAITATLTALCAALTTGPATATTSIGTWYTNHSRCTYSDGHYIDTQGIYQNTTDGMGYGLKFTRAAGAASKAPGLGIFKVELWSYWSDGARIDHDVKYLPNPYTKPAWAQPSPSIVQRWEDWDHIGSQMEPGRPKRMMVMISAWTPRQAGVVPHLHTCRHQFNFDGQ